MKYLIQISMKQFEIPRTGTSSTGQISRLPENLHTEKNNKKKHELTDIDNQKVKGGFSISN